MATAYNYRQRFAVLIELDLESNQSHMDDARREVELAAADAIEMARANIREKTSARVESSAFRSIATVVPGRAQVCKR